MSEKTVYLITSNSDKIKSAEKAFKKTSINLQQLDNDYREIQASNSLEIARNTVKQAMKDNEKPVIKEDHSMYLNAIPGFPGPYISYFDQKIPAEKLLELLDQEDDRTGYFEIGTVLGLPNGEIKEYEFQVPIKIAKEIKGNQRNWDRILMLKNENQTFAETENQSRLNTWNQNYRKIAEKLSNN